MGPSGVVTATGKKVNDWNAGDEVFGLPDLNRNGLMPEYIAVKAEYLAKKTFEPDSSRSGNHSFSWFDRLAKFGGMRKNSTG